MPPLTLDELLRTEDPAWPALRQWLADATNPASIWTTPRRQGEAALLALQVSAQSTLGAMALYTAGVSVDGGWMRLLGAGGGPLLDGLVAWNGLDGGPRAMSGGLVVAHDVLGGFFVVNGGAFGGQPGMVFYRAPRTWVDLGVGYTDFVRWVLGADLDRFYNRLRWPGWREDTRALQPDQGFAFEPDLLEVPDLTGEHAIEARGRRPARSRELWSRVALASRPGVGEA